MLVGMIIPGEFVALLGSLYYYLPRGSGDRISFLSTILLTEIMFLVMVTQVVPQTKVVPAIAYLFLEQTIILAMTMIVALFLDKVQVNHDKEYEKF